MSDQTYGAGRAKNLEAMLRSLAERIRQLDAGNALLSHTGELMQLIGDVRSELFHYEVRITYDTPEVAENRRIIAEATQRPDETPWEKTRWDPKDEDPQEW